MNSCPKDSGIEKKSAGWSRGRAQGTGRFLMHENAERILLMQGNAARIFSIPEIAKGLHLMQRNAGRVDR
jgi:hypothetical protein